MLGLVPFRRFSPILFVFAFLPLPITQVIASQVSTPFTVSTTVLDVCVVASTPLAFANYSGNDVSATNQITVTCTPLTNWEIQLNTGTGTGSSYANRVMTLPVINTTLNYNIYTDANHSTVWGDGTLGTATVSGTGTGIAQVKTAYGLIPGSQFVRPGAYADTVTATVIY